MVGLIWSPPFPRKKVKHVNGTDEQQLWPLRVATLLRGKACWSGGQDPAGLPRQSWGHPLSQSHFPPVQNDGAGQGECEGSLKHPGAIMWVYQKQLTLESAHSWVPIRILPSSISVSKVLLPCSLEHHEPLPARPGSPASVVQTWEQGHSPSTATTLPLLLTKRPTQQERAGIKLPGRAGGGALESRLWPQAHSLTPWAGPGHPETPGAPSAVNTQSPENIRMESCQGPQPFK